MLVLCSDIAVVERFVSPVSDGARSLLLDGGRPTTVILPAVHRLLAPNLLAADGTIGVRIPRMDFCLSLLQAFGRPIVSTWPTCRVSLRRPASPISAPGCCSRWIAACRLASRNTKGEPRHASSSFRPTAPWPSSDRSCPCNKTATARRLPCPQAAVGLWRLMCCYSVLIMNVWLFSIFLMRRLLVEWARALA